MHTSDYRQCSRMGTLKCLHMHGQNTDRLACNGSIWIWMNWIDKKCFSSSPPFRSSLLWQEFIWNCHCCSQSFWFASQLKPMLTKMWNQHPSCIVPWPTRLQAQAQACMQADAHSEAHGIVRKMCMWLCECNASVHKFGHTWNWRLTQRLHVASNAAMARGRVAEPAMVVAMAGNNVLCLNPNNNNNKHTHIRSPKTKALVCVIRKHLNVILHKIYIFWPNLPRRGRRAFAFDWKWIMVLIIPHTHIHTLAHLLSHSRKKAVRVFLFVSLSCNPTDAKWMAPKSCIL